MALATPQPDPFCASVAWQAAFAEAIDADRPSIVRHSADGLIQFALHTLGGAPVFGPLERLWLFGCNLLGPGAIDLLDELIAHHDAHGLPNRFVISGLIPGGHLLAGLQARFSERFALSRFRAEVQCAASLAGGFDGYLSRRSTNHRRNLRRGFARATEDGIAFERHCPKSNEEADALFARMLAVELVSWKGLEGRGMEQPDMQRFYSLMLGLLRRDARVILATHEGRDIGFIFGGMLGRIYRGQQFSFDEDYRAYSIGNLLQWEQLRWLCEEGAERYDMGPLLGPSMAYKVHWTELRLPIEAWFMQSRESPAK